MLVVLTPSPPPQVLIGGTERAFSDMSFSPDGTQLATVGSAPDYLLHVWDWKAESVILRSKAFSQEVRTACMC